MPDYDIYTKKPLINGGTDEHIIPDSFGGSRKARLLNADTNNYFGGGIDKKLYDVFHPIFAYCDLRSNSKKKKPPKGLKIKAENDGREWWVLPGGEFDHVDNQIIASSIDNSNDKLNVQCTLEGGSELTEKVAIEMICGRIQQAGHKIGDREKEQIGEVIRKNGIVISPRRLQWKLDFSVFQTDVYRAIVKIACNFYAYYNRESFYEPEFDAVRNFVLHGTGDPPLQLIPPCMDTGSFCHAVAFSVDDEGEVIASVAIFGQVSFLIRLGKIRSTRSQLTENSRIYRVDQPGQKSKILNRSIRLPRFDSSLSLHESIHKYAEDQRIRLICYMGLASVAYSGNKCQGLPENEAYKIRDKVPSRFLFLLLANGISPFILPYLKDTNISV